jgi:uncharacterized phage protein (TIGR02220 family)
LRNSSTMTKTRLIKSDVDFGYIKLYRKILDSQVFVHEKTLKIWIWCLLKANFKPKWIDLKIGKGSTEIEVKRGQFIFGRNKAADELNMRSSTVYSHMQKLVRMGNIIMDSNNQYSIVTICKYDSYQKGIYSDMTSNEQVTDNQRTTNGQLTDTTNKENNDKKERINPEYAQFITTFNLKTGKQFKGDTKSKGQFDKCLSEGYTLEDFEEAIINCLEDDYHKKNPKYLTPEFITRKDKLEMYLNARSRDNGSANVNNMVY